MKAYLPAFLLACFLLLRVHAHAQTTSTGGTGGTGGTGTSNATESDSNRAYWQASFANGGHYMVRLSNVASASKQIYISDGLARVVEVNIGCDSATVVRFYFLEPVGKDTPIAAASTILDRGTDLAKQAAGKVSPTASQLQVVKNYPTSTHAHTVEFVIQDEATINSLYSSLMSAINTGKGRTWNEAGSSGNPAGAPSN